ncbi:MAG: ferric reductase-like transmembrane domain-containing protein [Thermoleophilia bacterium]
MKHDPTFWLLARATGFTAYGLLAATMAAGVVLRSRPFRRLRPPQVMEIHRFISLMGLVALAAHGISLYLDRTIEITPLDLVVPGIAPYRPVWTGVGVIAGELMLILHVSFRLRKRIGVRVWRRLHWASYAAIAGGTLHGLLAGSDSGTPLALGAYAFTLALLVGLIGWRATMRPAGARTAGARPPAPGRRAPAEAVGEASAG